MVAIIKNLFNKPTPAMVMQKTLRDSELALIEAQGHRESADATVKMYEARIRRLKEQLAVTNAANSSGKSSVAIVG
ncbi:hypothetical protein [Ralstonia phage RP13]|nr:hypothetical protein [Ralstonia phage RP13]